MASLGALVGTALSGRFTSIVATRDIPSDPRSQHTVYVLTILSLSFASISVLSTLSTLYWFVKMRRSFRHDSLILLLIQSDFIKSAAFLLFPIVNLLRGNIKSDSPFCQISGFALALGIESSDVAVLLIALHSVMYIFRPKSGLYPYRRFAYLVYYLFPVVTASLAFIDGNGYENLGHYCYIRTDRSWARLALSWAPRYIIVVSIMVIYAFIYIYIRRRMEDYGRRSSAYQSQPRPARDYYNGVPPTPPIAYHGLLPSTPSSRRGSAADSMAGTKDRQQSLSSMSASRLDNISVVSAADPHQQSFRATILSRPPRRPVRWNWSGFRQATHSSADNELLGPAEDEPDDPLSPSPAPISPPRPVHSPPAIDPAEAAEVPTESSSTTNPQQSFWHRPLGSNYPTHPGSTSQGWGIYQLASGQRRPNISLPNIMSMLRRGPQHATTSSETSPIVMSPASFEGGSGVNKSREKMRRQLRSLFVYPLVYMITWVFPFISHVAGFDDSVRTDDPPWLLIVSIISLCAQGAVDCTLFTIREQPWRHAHGRFLDLLRKRLTMHWSGHWADVGLAGRTREEMLVDGRIARQRRDGEIAYERTVRASMSTGQGQGQAGPPRRGRKEWWDTDILDGASDESDDFSQTTGQGV
ncbi:G protein-coupled glucose receptor regulating Gpa2-domain-containing protein [Lasiosphaeria ovina]|uniref:G protein-coupled glucose receptor regulating Gpa2-domain-containing protein n=1 Tax=Lasiosphaeria ovina TaxID=92902 RepID=A0AAE0ND19_9PEZI|nr:G protein-coupled glucose receptor regulating Gpa2-domain-containing protein [Lasiosphaeria ovina]